MKASRTGFVIHGKYSDIVEYEYKGAKYEVEYAKGMTYCCTPPHIQHKDAQEKIDKAVEADKLPKKQYKYEDTAEYALNMFWDYVNG